jgi:hypothetical protein
VMSPGPGLAPEVPVSAAGAGPPASAREESLPDAGELIRKALKSQRASEQRFDSYTFDQREEKVAYRSDGTVRETKRRLFYVFSGPEPDGSSRELVEVDGRPATPDEIQKAAEGDRKSRRRRLEARAAARVSGPNRVGGDQDDPEIGSRRLSDLIRRFDFRVTGREELAGRAAWVVEFSPRPGAPENSLGDRALNALTGRGWIDVSDLQVRRVEAVSTRPVRVAGGIAANVKRAAVSYEAAAIAPGFWFPTRIALRLEGKKALFFPLNVGYTFELSNFRSFAVETESSIAPP